MTHKAITISIFTLIFACIIGAQSAVFAQNTGSYEEARRYEAEIQQKDRRIAADIRGGNESRFGSTDDQYGRRYFGFDRRNLGARHYIRSMSKMDRELIATFDEDENKYAEFLDQKDTGIVRLQDNGKCLPNKYVVSVNCTWNVIGNASAFSFRHEKYSNLDYADILYRTGNFEFNGDNQLTLIAEIDNAPISQLSPNSAVIISLGEFELATTSGDLSRQVQNSKKGIRVENVEFSDRAQMKLNATYLIRSVVFKTKAESKAEKKLNRMYGDNKQRDVIAAFQVVRIHDDGSVSILWRKFKETKSPRID